MLWTRPGQGTWGNAPTIVMRNALRRGVTSGVRRQAASRGRRFVRPAPNSIARPPSPPSRRGGACEHDDPSGDRSVLEYMGYDEGDHSAAAAPAASDFGTRAWSVFTLIGSKKPIHPQNQVYKLWKGFTTVPLVLVTALLTPLRFAFNDESMPVSLLDYAVDLVFALDVAVALNTCYYDEASGRLVQDAAKIRRRYLTTWTRFPADLLGVAQWPLVLLLGLYEGENATPIVNETSITLTLSLLRLFRLKRLVQLFQDLERDYQMDYVLVSMAKLLTLFFMLGHWAACGFYYLARLRSFDESTWVHHLDPHMTQLPLFEQYINSLYWAVATATTVGYGDVVPVNTAERLLAVLVMTANLGLTAYVLGTITIIATRADAQTAAFRDEATRLAQYLQQRNVSADVRAQALRSALQRFEPDQSADDRILQILPADLRQLVLCDQYRSSIRSCPSLMSCSPEFLDALMEGIEEVHVEKGRRLLMKGEAAPALYVLRDGTLSIQVSGMSVDVLHGGQAVGMEGAVFGLPQPADAFVQESCTLLAIPAQHIASLQRAFRRDLDRLREREVRMVQQQVEQGDTYLQAHLTKAEAMCRRARLRPAAFHDSCLDSGSGAGPGRLALPPMNAELLKGGADSLCQDEAVAPRRLRRGVDDDLAALQAREAALQEQLERISEELQMVHAWVEKRKRRRGHSKGRRQGDRAAGGAHLE